MGPFPWEKRNKRQNHRFSFSAPFYLCAECRKWGLCLFGTKYGWVILGWEHVFWMFLAFVASFFFNERNGKNVFVLRKYENNKFMEFSLEKCNMYNVALFIKALYILQVNISNVPS